MLRTDVCIAGGGIIGLTLALELQARGLNVVVLEAGAPMREASIAAAGMLAVQDPHNPPQLLALSQLSLALYPEFMRRIAALSGIDLPFQTSLTLQLLSKAAPSPLSSELLDRMALADHSNDGRSLPIGFQILYEHSIDPRQLAGSLVAAVTATPVNLFTREAVVSARARSGCVAVSTSVQNIEAAHFVDCTGAWATDPAFAVVPIKGQMLAVSVPEDLPLTMSIRTRDLYIVPRMIGPDAGRAIIGATIEDAGFDKTVDAMQIDALHRKAATLLPQLSNAAIVRSWAGLRPAAPDLLPLLGPHPVTPRHWIATGHYRNGILLAPATARVMADLMLGETPPISIEAFSPSRPMLPGQR